MRSKWKQGRHDEEGGNRRQDEEMEATTSVTCDLLCEVVYIGCQIDDNLKFVLCGQY
jgi:hypothetical protein